MAYLEALEEALRMRALGRRQRAEQRIAAEQKVQVASARLAAVPGEFLKQQHKETGNKVTSKFP